MGKPPKKHKERSHCAFARRFCFPCTTLKTTTQRTTLLHMSMSRDFKCRLHIVSIIFTRLTHPDLQALKWTFAACAGIMAPAARSSRRKSSSARTRCSSPIGWCTVSSDAPFGKVKVFSCGALFGQGAMESTFSISTLSWLLRRNWSAGFLGHHYFMAHPSTKLTQYGRKLSEKTPDL